MSSSTEFTSILNGDDNICEPDESGAVQVQDDKSSTSPVLLWGLFLTACAGLAAMPKATGCQIEGEGYPMCAMTQDARTVLSFSAGLLACCLLNKTLNPHDDCSDEDGESVADTLQRCVSLL